MFSRKISANKRTWGQRVSKTNLSNNVIITEGTMKKLILSICCVVSAISVTAFADPNDPFSPDSTPSNISNYQCTSDQHSKESFCGGQPAGNTDTKSCFKKETVNSCNYMKAHGGSIPSSCSWDSEYHFIQIGTPASFMCSFQAHWCSQQGYKDCQTIEQNCVNDINQFRSQCMNQK